MFHRRQYVIGLDHNAINHRGFCMVLCVVMLRDSCTPTHADYRIVLYGLAVTSWSRSPGRLSRITRSGSCIATRVGAGIPAGRSWHNESRNGSFLLIMCFCFWLHALSATSLTNQVAAFVGYNRSYSPRSWQGYIYIHTVPGVN